jgi:hypothetical protein
LGLKLVKLDRACIADPAVRLLAELCPIVIATKRSRSHHEATFFSSSNRAGASDALLKDRRQRPDKFSLHSLPHQLGCLAAGDPAAPGEPDDRQRSCAAYCAWVGLIGDGASTAFRLSMPIRDVSVGACLGMNRLGKYSFARHRQEARPGCARGLVAQAAAIAVRIRAGRDLEPSSSSLPRDGVDRALG